MAKPILKWAGGKRELLDEIYARFPEDYVEYHEPFLGGGAVFFDLEPEGGTVNDTNTRLMNFYRVVRDHPEELINRLRDFDAPSSNPNPDQEFAEKRWKGKETKNYYEQQRARFNRRPYSDDIWPAQKEEKLEEAALFLYLNRTCYNGLYRENSKGGFNVPKGDYTNPDWIQEDRIQAASKILAENDIFNGDFSYILENTEEGDLVYFDPPYKPLSTTADFTEYNAASFGQEEQQRLVETAKNLDERGVSFVLSNSGVMFEKYEKAGFDVERQAVPRPINSNPKKRGEVDEILVTNVPTQSRRPVSVLDY